MNQRLIGRLPRVAHERFEQKRSCIYAILIAKPMTNRRINYAASVVPTDVVLSAKSVYTIPSSVFKCPPTNLVGTIEPIRPILMDVSTTRKREVLNRAHHESLVGPTFRPGVWKYGGMEARREGYIRSFISLCIFVFARRIRRYFAEQEQGRVGYSSCSCLKTALAFSIHVHSSM